MDNAHKALLGSLDVRRKDTVAPNLIPMAKAEQYTVQLDNCSPSVLPHLGPGALRPVREAVILPDSSWMRHLLLNEQSRAI